MTRLIMCDCGHQNHPVKGKPRPFKNDGIWLKYFQCGKCKKLLAIQSKDRKNWKSISKNKLMEAYAAR